MCQACQRIFSFASRKEIEGMMAIVVRGDALNPEQVQKAFDQIEEVDAVVSTIGGTPADPNADSQVPNLETAVLHQSECCRNNCKSDKLHKLDMLITRY